MIVTGDMKMCFSRFPNVLFVDSTYCVNKLRMPLYSFLVDDCDGIGRVAAYCFVRNEKKSTIASIFEQFATIHDVSMIKCVIVDKLLNEITAIKTFIPSAVIQLCKFHVMQAAKCIKFHAVKKSNPK